MDSSKEFLIPGSMLTPGLAGGMTMAITNVVSGQFSISAPGPAYVGLGLSFLFGLLVWVNRDVSLTKRVVYYVLNSLVIFVVAVGSNTVGRAGTTPEARSVARSMFETLAPPANFLISNAAAEPKRGWCCVGDKATAASHDECTRSKGRFFASEDPAKQACAAPGLTDQPRKHGDFFRPWIRVGVP